MEGGARIGLSWFVLATLGVSLGACNLGQGNDSTVSVQGNWSGRYSAQGSQESTPVFALMRQDGAAYLFDTTGNVAVLPRFTGTQRTTGSVTVYPAKGYTFADGSTSKPLDMEATATGSSIDMELSAADQGTRGEAQLLYFETFSAQPAVKAGSWTGSYLSPTPVALALEVAADGTFTGNDAYGCRLSGSLSQVESGSTLFAVALDSRGASPACGGAMTGLAHESSDDSFGFFQESPGTYYYLCASNARGAFVAEFRVQ